MEALIRPAETKDLDAVNRLLRQVLSVHHDVRPDLFRAEGKKYSDQELLEIFSNPDTPVFVYEKDGSVLGYIFCAFQHSDSGSLVPHSTLYIDDLCVDASARGGGIGKALYRRAEQLAREKGCHNLTLHVWEGNPGARAFYEALGMKPQYTSMETIL